MAFKAFRQLKLDPNASVTPKVVNDLQYNIAVALGQLLGKDPLDISLIKNVTLQPGIINKVPHQLGRTLQGYIVVRTHGGYTLLQDAQDTNPSPDKLLYLVNPVSVTVDLLVF